MVSILSKGWDVYEPLHSENSLRKITDSSDANVQNCFYIWAIKPQCSFFKIEPKPWKENRFHFEILDEEQKNFDFIDIIFNTRKDEKFICNSEKNNIDFETTPYLLSKESMDWLINAIEKTYPEGNKRLEQLKTLQQSL